MKLPVIGRITSVFGYRIHPITKVKSFHNGIDIACKIGTEVICPSDGKVILVDNTDDSSGGIQLAIDHGTFRTGYAHLSEILVKMSEQVKTGQTIATTGNTGIGTGAHLHFTFTNEKGIKENPLNHFDGNFS